MILFDFFFLLGRWVFGLGLNLGSASKLIWKTIHVTSRSLKFYSAALQLASEYDLSFVLLFSIDW